MADDSDAEKAEDPSAHRIEESRRKEEVASSKELSSVLILTAVCFRAAGGFHMFDLYFSFAGTIGWLWVGILWHDRALIMLNGALATLLMTGIFKELFACSNCMIPL